MEARSLKSAEILNPNKEKKVEMMTSNTIKLINTANVVGTFLFSIQLQKGKNKVAKIPPMHNGIKKSFEKYNPKKIRNNISSFLILAVNDVVITLGGFKFSLPDFNQLIP